MIEVLILIAVALIGILLVLGRISLTLKGIHEAMTEAQGSSTLGSPSIGNGADGIRRTQSASTQHDLSAPSAQSAESPSSESRSGIDALQDIAAVVAVAERARRQSSSEPRAS